MKRLNKKAIVAIIVIVAILLTSAAGVVTWLLLKPKDDAENKKPPSTETGEIVEDDEIEEELEDLEEGEDYYYDEEGNLIVVNRPYTDGKTSSGKLPDSESAEEDEWENLEDIDNGTAVEYEPLIQKYGKKVMGPKRQFTVYNGTDGILFKNFSGIGTNSIPTDTSLNTQIQGGNSEAHFDIQYKRHNDVSASYARTWFQLDWMITNTVGDDYEKYAYDWDNNQDYVNYINGVYDFESEMMQAFWDYCYMLEDADTDLYIAFGWKQDKRIQNWFSADPLYSASAAPYDVKAYARAAKAFFKYAINDKGLTNIKMMGFYNEAIWDGYNGDYVTVGDKFVHYGAMVKAVHKLFKADNQLKEIEFIGVDGGNFHRNNETELSDYCNNNLVQYFDYFGDHEYYTASGKANTGNENFYSGHFDYFCYIYNHFKVPVFMSEFDTNDDKGIKNHQFSWDEPRGCGWDGSTTSYYIAAANNGIPGMLKWGISGGQLTSPQNFDPISGSGSCWDLPKNEGNINNEVHYSYYMISLLNNYVPRPANVHNIEWEGDDVRGSAFTSQDGKDFALVVEANEKSIVRNLDINLKKSLSGKTLYVYSFNFNQKCDGNATVPKLVEAIDNVNSSFSYTINGDYGIYIFSTIKPIKQVALFTNSSKTKTAVYNKVKTDGTVSITPELIDCASTDAVEWEISRYSCAKKMEYGKEVKRKAKEEIPGADLGSISIAGDGTVTYTPAADAQNGEYVSLICKIKGTDRYATALIEITE